MLRQLSIVLVLVTVVSGCGPSAKEKYDAAVQEVDQAQAQLDKLRPGYDTARQTAANAVCREITGTSPEESDSAAALQGLDLLNQTAAAPPEETKKGDVAKKAPTGRKGDELDRLVDNAEAAQKQMSEKMAALGVPVAKANEVRKVMTNIKTPGTPEAKKFEEKLSTMQEAKAYERQQKRLERAQKDVEEAEKDLK